VRLYRIALPALGGALVLLWYLISFFMDAGNPQTWGSPRVVAADMFTASPVAWSLAAGLGATDAVLLMRRGNRALVEGLPPRGRVWLAVRRLGLVWGGLVGATLVACGLAVVFALPHGGRPSWAVLALVPMAVCGLAAFAGIGYALGLWWPTWFIPPLVTVAGYVLSNLDPAGFLQDYGGAFLPGSAVQHPVTLYYVLLAGLFVLLAAGAAVWMAVRWWRGWLAVAIVSTLVCAVALGVVKGTLESADALWADDDHAAWPCHPLPGGPSVCVPRDLPGDVALATGQLAPVAPQLVALDPDLSGIRWVPGRPGEGELRYVLPLGQTISAWAQGSETVGDLAAPCFARYESADVQWPRELWSDSDTVAAWLADNVVNLAPGEVTDVALPVSPEEAQAAYARILACDY